MIKIIMTIDQKSNNDDNINDNDNNDNDNNNGALFFFNY